MCGLLTSTDPTVASTSGWDAAMAVLECRGPDSSSVAARETVAMGHRRLEIIGVGAPGRQPYQRGEQTLVFNGEIYNYRELASSLGIPPDSDTHVLFEILSRGDLALLRNLRGMFAFVFHDAATDTLLTLRDGFGIKPLYVGRHSDGELTFASVPAAIAPLLAPQDRLPDPVALAGFLASGLFPAGTSAFASIEKLPPGELREWRRGGHGWAEEDRWQVEAVSDPRMLSVPEAIADSVRTHLTADVPVGVLMSGGVDSTLVAALAARELGEVRTFSLVNPDNPEIDESQFARWNSELIGSRHTEVPVRPRDLAAEWLPLLASSGEPFGDPAFLALAALCRVVSQDVKAVLAGEGADELFRGYRRYQVEGLLYRRGMAQPIGSGAGLMSRVLDIPSRAPSNRARTITAWASGPGFLGHSALLGGEWDAVSTAFPESAGAALAAAQADWSALIREDPTTEIFTRYDAARWLPNVYLEKSDRASMLHGLEVRVPFLDPVVARACLHAGRPRDTKKMPLRRLLTQLLPDVRLPRQKKGLAVAVPELVRTPLAQAALRLHMREGSDLMDALGVKSLTRLRQRADVSPGLAFRLATTALWWEIWIAGDRAASLPDLDPRRRKESVRP